MKQGDFPISVSKIGRVRACLKLLRESNIRGKVLVDVGSTFGWLEREIADWGAKRVIGIEPNQKPLLFAQRNIRAAKFIQGMADKIPLVDSYADIVLLFDVIEHVPVNGEEVALKEIARILKKDGVLLLSTPDANVFSNILDPAWYFGHRHYNIYRLTETLNRCGFKVTEKEIKGGYWGLFYMICFYLVKWLFKQDSLRWPWLSQKYDKDYQKNGFVTIFLKARKI